MTTLERLIGIDGLDIRFGGITEPEWRTFVEHVAETLDVGPGSRVFQVGCGAGAVLFPLSENGYIVGGMGSSPELIEHARLAMPAGRFTVGDASELDPAEPWDVVLDCGGFPFLSDLDHARGVMARMAAKASHAIAILDIPDIDREDHSLEKYHLFYDRRWMLKALAEIGASAVQIEAMKLAGHENRFNVFARI